jgi:hypothetical protein
VQAAFDSAEAAGMVIVAAAGNSGNPPGRGDSVIYPAKYASVIAVAATDSADARASFSSTGDAVELAAPGVSVFSTWNDSTGYYAPAPLCRSEEGVQECYKYGSGTSMASPHVAGVAALVIAGGITDSNENGRINDEVRYALTSTADDLGAAGRDPHFGYGLVNAVAATGETPPPPEPVTDIAVSALNAPAAVAPGDLVDVLVTVANVGDTGVAESIVVSLADQTDGVSLGAQSVAGLSAGAAQTLTFVWDTGSASLGSHTLQASHNYADDAASNDALATEVLVSEPAGELTVSGVVPDSIPGGAMTSVTISGEGFAPGAVVSFENGAGPAPAAVVTGVAADGTAIYADVTAKSTPKPRTWDLRVTNPDGGSAALAGALTIMP